MPGDDFKKIKFDLNQIHLSFEKELEKINSPDLKELKNFLKSLRENLLAKEESISLISGERLADKKAIEEYFEWFTGWLPGHQADEKRIASLISDIKTEPHSAGWVLACIGIVFFIPFFGALFWVFVIGKKPMEYAQSRSEIGKQFFDKIHTFMKNQDIPESGEQVVEEIIEDENPITLRQQAPTPPVTPVPMWKQAPSRRQQQPGQTPQHTPTKSSPRHT